VGPPPNERTMLGGKMMRTIGYDEGDYAAAVVAAAVVGVAAVAVVDASSRGGPNS